MALTLSTEHLSVRVGKKEILKDVSLTFKPGKKTAIIGPNGAGKSTLLRALARLNTDYTGRILLGGEETKKIGRKRLARSLAILPQGMAAPPDTTVSRLVSYGRFPYQGFLGGGESEEDRAAIEWALTVTRLEAFRDRQVARLSGGERQRAWIAMALAQRPKILLLDEPTTYLDIAHQLDVMQLVQSISDEYGMTVIMVLHDINHALQYADELAVIKEGRLFAAGSPKELLSVGLIEKVFGVRADVFTNSQGASVLSPVELVR